MCSVDLTGVKVVIDGEFIELLLSLRSFTPHCARADRPGEFEVPRFLKADDCRNVCTEIERRPHIVSVWPESFSTVVLLSDRFSTFRAPAITSSQSYAKRWPTSSLLNREKSARSKTALQHSAPIYSAPRASGQKWGQPTMTSRSTTRTRTVA